MEDKAEADIQKILARNFRIARIGLGLSQTLLARRSGIPQPTICRIERAAINLRLSTLAKIAAAIGQPVQLLLTETE